MNFENKTFIPDLKDKNYLLFDQREYQNESELSSTNESSNSFNLGIFQNDFMKNSFDRESPIFNFEEFFPLFGIKEETFENKLYFIENPEKQQDVFESNSLLTKKRGRGNKNSLNSTSSENDKKIHDKFSTDNLLRKIQIHYLSFIISFINDILKYLNYNQRFLKLDYRFKKNVNKNFVESLRQKTIGEIICNDVSIKYRRQHKDANKKIYEEIKNDRILNNILSENYLKFFKKIYYKINRIINLKEYGLDKDIVLSENVKSFKYLLEPYDSIEEKEYKKNIIECAMQNYIPNSIFLLS
jgi:hypothetical protein